MKKSILLIIALLALSGVKAQVVYPGYSYSMRNGLGTSYYFESGPFGFFPADFIKKNKIDSACVQTLNCANGKTTGTVASQSEIIYDSTTRPVKRTYFENGKMKYSYRYHTTPLAGRGWAYSTEAWNKRYRLTYASLHHYDSVGHSDSSWIKHSDKKPFYLSYVSVNNVAKLPVFSGNFNQKGQLYSETKYTYNETGKALQTMATFKKGKLIRFTDYRCKTQPDTLKIHIVNVCERTDKDPMGNIIEIKEQKIGKKAFVVKYKYTPDKKRLIEVAVTSGKAKNNTRISYAYDDRDRVIQIEQYYGTSAQPLLIKKYTYPTILSARSETYKKGKLTGVYLYWFNSSAH
ncbi:MAG: hypothetical protein K1X81_12520 [Bacteroidia bacterium]|nr:hypothetical protein [Bacteroidia bacterium]